METYTDYLDEFNDKVNNTDNKREIQQTRLDIHESKEKIKKAIKLHKEENKQGYINEAVDEYKNVLLDLITKYNTLQYNYYTMEVQNKKDTDDNNKNQKFIYTLCKKKYTTKDIEITIDASYKIISNKK
jgi:hypothetical protein